MTDNKEYFTYMDTQTGDNTIEKIIIDGVEKYKPFYELGAKCTQLNEVADSLNNLNSKYKSALEEIREIAKDIIEN